MLSNLTLKYELDFKFDESGKI